MQSSGAVGGVQEDAGDKSEDYAERFGQSLSIEADYTDWLARLASTRCRLIIKDVIATDLYAGMIKDGVLCILVDDERLIVANDKELVVRHYRAVFKGERSQWETELDHLEDEHTCLTLGLQEQPTQRAKDKVKAKIQQIESEMADLERKLKDDAGEYERSVTEWRRMTDAWDRVTEVIESESSAPRKAEVVRGRWSKRSS